MSTSRQHFALDWIKGELLETLNTARGSLESYAESLEPGGLSSTPPAEATAPLRDCVNALHQAHGTLIMLELEGVTLLADHLERVAAALMSGEVTDLADACQHLMQGILELPGYLDELQNGMPDSAAAMLPLINELRKHLGEAALAPGAAAVQLYGIAGDSALARFRSIGGVDKTRKIRSVYQQVLLSLLKGGELERAVETLRKVAQGLGKVCEGTPFQAQWQAFGEFVEALAASAGALDADAVKLLRRVDSEIRELAQSGAEALRRPLPLGLVRQLLDAAAARGRRSELLDALTDAAAQGDPAPVMSLSGRQALVSAATALREELGGVKDRLDLFVRGGRTAPAQLADLVAPLKQVASTLSLLGFESSKSIVLDQVDVLNAVVESAQADEGTILTIAGALVQVDENLASLTQSGKGEAEQITGEAQRAVANQARDGLELVKQAIVDYVASQWDVRHLQAAPAHLDSIVGALGMIPLTQAADLVRRCERYLRLELMAGHVPSWEELDRLADGLSGIDYYLERLASDSPGGADDVLELAQRSLDGLAAAAGAAEPAESRPATAAPEPVDAPAPTAAGDSATVEPLFGGAEDVNAAEVGIDRAGEEPALEHETDADFDLSSGLFDAIPGEVHSAGEVPDVPAAADDFELELDDDPAAGDFEVGAGDDVAVPSAPAAEAPSPAGAPLDPSLVDSFESDDEIVEIFSEEVDEVLAAVDEQLEPWSAAIADESHQMEIRRAFHTLKGSGRLVGARVLGEMAWSVENMLNRAIDETVAVTADFVRVVGEARALAPRLRDHYIARTAPPMAEVASIIERADLLGSGGSLADADADSASEGAEAAEAHRGDAVPGAGFDEDRQLFLDEAAGHVDSLLAACRNGGFMLGDGAMRALHTLSGSAALAGLDAVAELAAPAYELAQALRQPGAETLLGGEPADFFRQVTEALTRAVAAMRDGREVEEQFQLIADADRLLLEAEAPPAGSLMALPALASIVNARQLLEGWQDGDVDPAQAEEIRAALHEIEETAGAGGLGAVADLAGALRRAHERFDLEPLPAGAHDVFERAHDTLLEQFDALAADQTPEAAAPLCETLDALVPEPVVEDLPEAGEALESEMAPAEPHGLETPVVTAAQPARGPEPAGEAVPSAAAATADLVPEDVDADIIEVFFEEADEILESLDQGINDWQEEPDNLLHLENLLRALHTLKGGARLSGLARLGDATHEFESYLIAVQEGQQSAGPALFDELHGRYDDISALIARIRAAVRGEPPQAQQAAPPQPGVAETVAENAAAVAPPADAPLEEHTAAETDAAQPRVAAEPADEPEDTPVAAHADNVAPLRPPAPAAEPEARPAARQPARVADKPAENKQDVAAAQARAAQEMVRVGAGLLESLVNLAGESSIIRARVEQGMSDFTSALDEMETTIERLREQLRRLEIETETQVLFRQERLDGPSYEEFDPLEMDRYSQLQQLSRALGESASDMLDLKETLLNKAREAETLLLQQARVNTELQEGLMRSRMVPFSRLVPRLKRTVRQVAKELDKEVELHAFNIEGELDRSLLERMVPPLEHMLRNAVDHGIEKPERRRSVGKAEAGRIDLRLSREGGDVVIEISDDGAGIDVERVREKAVERGLMAADADLKDDEISQFVLAPGFSTAASVTQISGRGVGMDVVHSEVKQLGGSISIASQPGRGTRFVLRVPFTVSVNRALMVSVGEDLYAIPLNTIEGIVLLSAAELEQLYAPDGNTFEYAGVPYRVQYLGSFIGREYHPTPMGGSVPVVLVRSGEHAVAVHVDGVQGSREIVVKSLGPQFAGVGGISGATILGDGSVVVILDLLALIRSSQRGPGIPTARRTRTGAPRTRTVMVVDDSVTVRKVTSRLLERQGMDVLVAKDGVEAVSLLQEQRPDVMLLDIEMPRMDGFEVLRQVRHDERLRDLPIVMISSRTGSKHQERAAELGVSRFLGKPFQENELLATIDDLVHG